MSETDQDHTILVVDDDDVSGQLLSVLLQEYGKIERVKSGEEALKKVVSIAPDLIILDIEMPDMDGYAVCEHLKSDEKTAAIPIVFLTGNNSNEDEERGLDAGAVDFIRKPISPGIVRMRTSNILNLLAATRKLEHLASTDPLTGAFNRRHFFEAGNAELHRSKRYKHPLSFLMLDIDHFKAVNDTYGHGVGDEALNKTVAVIRSILRDEDTLSRMGGEEFAVMLPQTDLKEAAIVAERIRDAIAGIVIETSTESFGFTASIGVSKSLDTDEDIDKTLFRADQSLYEAKKQGRNRVIAA